MNVSKGSHIIKLFVPLVDNFDAFYLGCSNKTSYTKFGKIIAGCSGLDMQATNLDPAPML